MAGLCADGRLWDGVVCAEDFEGFGIARSAVDCIRYRFIQSFEGVSDRIPSMCEDDVVAGEVFVATAGSRKASEAQFEDHVGGCEGV